MTSMTGLLEAHTARLAEAKELLTEMEERLAALVPQEQTLGCLSGELSQMLEELGQEPPEPVPRLPAGWEPGMFESGIQARVGPQLSALGQFIAQTLEHLRGLNGEIARHEDGIRRFTSQFRQAQKGVRRLQLEEQHEKTEILSAEVLEAASEERRRFGRGSRPPVKVVLDAGEVRSSGMALDLGVGGLFLATEDDLELGTLVHVSMELPGSSVVSGDGAVVWARAEGPGRRGLGIEFVAIDEQTRARIAAYSGES